MLQAIAKKIEAMDNRSAWKKGVHEYAIELIADLQENIERGYITEDDICNTKLLEKAMLNGADSWDQYSWGGCSLIYDTDIAERTCSPSELKKTKGGERRPNRREEWLDVQARALFQASNRIKKAFRMVKEV